MRRYRSFVSDSAFALPAPGSRVFSCNDGAVSNPLKFGEVVSRRLGGGEFVRFAQMMDARKMRQISDGGVAD